MLKIEKKSLRVGKWVNKSHVDEVIRNYKRERWVQNSAHIGKEDSLSAWFSIEELEDFIAASKEHGADGVKMYFAAYSKEYDEKPEYAGRQTIVMVATRTSKTADGIVDKDIYANTGKKLDILAYNFAKICPPMCKNARSQQIGITIVDRGDEGLSLI